MHPEFLKIGTFSIAWYGVMMVAGLVSGLIIAQKLAAQRGLNPKIMADLGFWAMIWGIVGARVVFVLSNPEAFSKTSTFIDYINVRNGGLAVHGALIAGMMVGLYYTFRHKMDFYRYGDLFAPMLGLGIIGGRMGNIMNGSDTPGRVTGWPGGFVWPDWARGYHDSMCNPATAENLVKYCQKVGDQMVMTAPVHFTQLYGVIIGIIIVVASYYWLRSKRPGWTFWQAIMWYSILRAGWEETFRLNPLMFNIYLSEGLDKPGIGLLTTTQVISIPLILVSMVMLYLISKQPEKPHLNEASLEEKASLPAGVA